MPQDSIDCRFGGDIDRPPAHLIDRLQLIRMPCTPQCRRDALVEHPAHRQVNDTPAEAIPGQVIQLLHRRQILLKPGALKLGIATAQIIALKHRIRAHPA